MMRSFPGAALLFVVVWASFSQLYAQLRVDARNIYERVMAVVPLTGTGTFDDPKRPMYAPSPAQIQTATATRTGILAFTYVLSDDGNVALVEFVARNRAAFQAILADPTIKSFLKGRDSFQAVQTEFLKHKANFNFAQFGVRMP